METAGGLVLLLAVLGCIYTLVAAWLVGGYRARPLPPSADAGAITVLKPLHGAEPRLRANLESLLAQDWRGPVQILFGVRALGDPAVPMAEALIAAHPAADIRLVIDATRHGSNAKVSNVVNLAAFATHPTIVLADSDTAWPPDSLRRLSDALAEPGVGLASCMHWGRGDAGFWSVLGAMDISYRFLPSIAVGIATGLARPCLGPTLALRRATLDAVGGFAAFADVLADDYELGAAVRNHGLRTVVPRFTIAHSGDEASPSALTRHELRWTRTIYGIDPWGFGGSIVTHCLILALIAALLRSFDGLSLGVLAAAALSRAVLVRRVDSVVGARSGPLLLVPLRDLMSFGVFLTTFFIRDIDWRGSRYRVTRGGRISNL